MDMRQIEQRLDRYSRIKPDLPCWLGGDNADPSYLYCSECASKAVADGKGEYVDGGYGYQEEDSCAHCHTCGKVLAYTLTNAGVEYELDHFKSVRFRGRLTKDDAYHIARVVEAAPENPEVIKLAERALAHLSR